MGGTIGGSGEIGGGRGDATGRFGIAATGSGRPLDGAVLEGALLCFARWVSRGPSSSSKSRVRFLPLLEREALSGGEEGVARGEFESRVTAELVAIALVLARGAPNERVVKADVRTTVGQELTIISAVSALVSGTTLRVALPLW